jgi:predicted kinase
MLVLIVGLPGTGKTTFAIELAKRIDAAHLNSDIIRTTLGNRGKYDTASKAAVYRELCSRAEEILQKGRNLIVDATLYKNVLREPFEKLANQFNIPIKWIELKADEATIRQRVSKKRKYSEADFEVYLKIKAVYQPVAQNHLVLWSDVLSLDEMIDKAQEYFALNEFSPK